MSNTTFSRMLSLAAIVLLAGCERVVTMDIEPGPTRLVIEGRLERVQGGVGGHQSIRLTTTSAYFNNVTPPPARGAIVRVSDGTGTSVTFAESPTEPGLYVTESLVVESGRTYTLTIDFGGETYSASEMLAPVAAIDRLYFALRPQFIGNENGLRATIDLVDPVGVKNWYLWDQFVDGVRLISPDPEEYYRSIASDDLQDGQDIEEFQPYDDIVVNPGQVVRVRQIGLSEKAYRYYQSLNEQTVGGGTPFSLPASSLRGNVFNVTNLENRPLGYFMVSEVAERQRVVP